MAYQNDAVLFGKLWPLHHFALTGLIGTVPATNTGEILVWYLG
jgi:hypothetical protein